MVGRGLHWRTNELCPPLHVTQGRADEHLKTHLRGHWITRQARDRDIILTALVPIDDADTEDMSGPGGGIIEMNNVKDGKDLADHIPWVVGDTPGRED